MNDVKEMLLGARAKHEAEIRAIDTALKALSAGHVALKPIGDMTKLAAKPTKRVISEATRAKMRIAHARNRVDAACAAGLEPKAADVALVESGELPAAAE